MPELARAAIALPIIFGVAGLKVLVHELGPKLIERVDRRGTTWCISLVPIRGYVALHPDTIQAGHLSILVRPGLGQACCHGRWPSCQPDPHRLPVGRPGAHQTPSHVDVRWPRNPGRPCRADCAGVPHHRPRSLLPTAPVHPSWHHSSLPQACTISWPPREASPSVDFENRPLRKITTRHDATLTRRTMERRDLRPAIHPCRPLYVIIIICSPCCMPANATAFLVWPRRPAPGPSASRSARGAPKTGRGIRQRLACRRRRSVGPEQGMNRSSSARCTRSPKGQPGKREARAEGAS